MNTPRNLTPTAETSQQVPHNVFRKQLYRSIVGAAVLAVIGSAVYVWGERHNNPKANYMEVPGEITLEGNPVKVLLGCNCPTYLTEGDLRELPFTVTLSLVATTAPPTPATSPASPRIYLSIDAGNSRLSPSGIMVSNDGYALLKNTGLKASTTLRIQPMDASLSQITFDFKSDYGSGLSSSLGSVPWPIDSQKKAGSMLIPYVFGIIVFCSAVGLIFWATNRMRSLRDRTEEKLAHVRSQADADPTKARFAWDLARVKLEAYFDRNLIQVNLVFWVAVLVMSVGFGFVLGGVVLAYTQPRTQQSFYGSTFESGSRQGYASANPGNQPTPAPKPSAPADQAGLPQVTSQTTSEKSTGPNITPASLVAAISGIITQFIGATFMVIYRSTMAQANGFMTVLERINAVGMAVQILDSMPEGTDLKNATRAQMVLLLLKTKPDPAADSASAEKKAQENPG